MQTREQKRRDRELSNRFPLAMIFVVTLYAALLAGLVVHFFRYADAGTDWNGPAAGLLGILLGSAVGYYHRQPVWGFLCAGLLGGCGAMLTVSSLSGRPAAGWTRAAIYFAIASILITTASWWLWRDPVASADDQSG